MLNIDQLFIRACKSNGDRLKRVHSVYRRFYGVPALSTVDRDLAAVLAGVVDRHDAFTMLETIDKLAPPSWGFQREQSYWERVIYLMIGRLTMLERTKILDYRLPLSYRNKYGTPT